MDLENEYAKLQVMYDELLASYKRLEDRHSEIMSKLARIENGCQQLDKETAPNSYRSILNDTLVTK